MREGSSLDQRIHVEFADFSQMGFFRLFEKHVVRNANSLGMNEQEMAMLLDYWADKESGEIQDDAQMKVKDSKPSF
jgi:ADP-dependent phosphofructokinase/glucokinase